VEQAPQIKRGLMRRFFRECVRPYAGLQVQIAICLIVGAVLSLIDPLVLKAIIDRALGDGDRGLLLALVALMGGVLLFRIAFRMLSVWLAAYSGLRILFDLRRRAFEHVERFSPYFFRGERTGDILARLTSDIDVLQRSAAHTLVNSAQDSLTIVGIVLVLAWLDPWLTLVLLALYPFLIAALARTNRRLRHEGTRAREAVAGIYTFLEERITCMRLIQEFRREKAEAQRYVRTARPWIHSNLVLSTIGGVQTSLGDLLTTGSFMLVFLFGGTRVVTGAMSVGALVAFYTLAVRLSRPISGLIDINIDLQVARASLGRIFEVLDREPQVREHPQASAPVSVPGAIELADLSHAWPDGTRALDAIHLSVPAGSIVALVGPSGSGKSTLAGMMARLLDPDQGQVRIDGLDVRQWTLKRLRQSVCLVPQETLLLHDTLRDNLRMARPRASDQDLLDALDAAGLGDLLKTLPDGLGTQTGEHGLRLSGGERQRLALARALLKRASITILDEATSALDPRTERRVLASMFERLRGRTVVIIAHRLMSITSVDHIFVLNQARLVESGTHRDLYQAKGLYHTFFEEQSRHREHAAAAPDQGPRRAEDELSS
jgi:ATP-binding cassette subfamily B protein